MRYIEAFGEIAQEGNTLVLPADAGNVPNMVATALKTFDTLDKSRMPGPSEPQIHDIKQI